MTFTDISLRMWTRREVAQYLGLTERTVESLRKRWTTPRRQRRRALGPLSRRRCDAADQRPAPVTEFDFQTELITSHPGGQRSFGPTVQAAAGPERAAMAAQIMIGLATRHLLYAQGPKARPRRPLSCVWADLSRGRGRAKRRRIHNQLKSRIPAASGRMKPRPLGAQEVNNSVRIT